MGPPLLDEDILGDLEIEGDLGTMEPPLEVADILGDLGAEAGGWARLDRGMSATWPHEILCWEKQNCTLAQRLIISEPFGEARLLVTK